MSGLIPTTVHPTTSATHLPCCYLQPPPASISATGRGVIGVDADLADLSITMEVKHDFSSPLLESVENRASVRQSELDVMAELAQQAAAVIAYLNNDKKCSKLKTTSLDMHHANSWELNGQRQLVSGVVASQTLACTTTSDKAGQVISGSVDAGATRIDSVKFRASPSVLNDARQRAVAAATTDALKQISTAASTVARVAGDEGNTSQQALYSISKQVVNSINVDSVTLPSGIEEPPTGIMPMMAMRSMAATAPMPVSAGEQTVTATVTAKATYV